MRVDILSVILGIIFSIPYGFGNWMKWQSMKKGTIIPYGSFTVLYGNSFSFFVKGLLFILIFFLSMNYLGWWAIVSVILMWFLGNWWATLVERELFCNNDRIDSIVFAAKEFVKDHGLKKAKIFIEEFAPLWWIKLMPSSWKIELKERLSNVLLVNLHNGTAGEDEAMSYYHQGTQYAEAGNYDAAIAAFTMAIEVNPKYAVVYNERGVAYGQKGNYDKAIVDFNKALDFNSRDAMALLQQGKKLWPNRTVRPSYFGF